MKDSISSVLLRQASGRDLFLHQKDIVRQGILRLLAIKDSDIRILTLEQGRDAVDQGLHAGGAFSATLPLVCSSQPPSGWASVGNPAFTRKLRRSRSFASRIR